MNGPQIIEQNGLDGSRHFGADSGTMGARRIARVFPMGDGVYAVTHEYLVVDVNGRRMVSDPPSLVIGCTSANQHARDHCRGW